MSRIVLISRTLFPLQSPRSQRTTQLAKGFASLGHDVTVYAVLGKYDYAQFEKENKFRVKKIGDMRFATLYRDRVTPSKSNLFYAVFARIFRKLFEYPDIELAFKVAKLLKKERDIDLLITVAVPYPIHWGSAYASRWFAHKNIKTWVADCGDPYMGNKLTKRLFYFKYIEKWFCRKADYLTVPLEDAKYGYYEEFYDKIRVIPQGFNFDEVKLSEKKVKNDVVTFIYAGNFYKGIRDPRSFLDYLCDLNLNFRFIVYTKSSILLDNYKERLEDRLIIKDYIPRTELLYVMSQVDFLVNFENNTKIQSPSKLIDYALSKRPILSVNPLQVNEEHINQFLRGDYTNQLLIQDVKQYDIKNVTSKFIGLMK